MYGQLPQHGLNALVYVHTPKIMIHGGWTQALYLDDRAGPEQRRALEAVFSGLVYLRWVCSIRQIGSYCRMILPSLKVLARQ